MRGRRGKRFFTITVLTVLVGLMVPGCVSGPQVAPDDARYAVPQTGHATVLPDHNPYIDGWAIEHALPAHIVLEPGSSRIGIIYRLPGVPSGYDRGIMMEVLDYETGDLVAREMLPTSEIQSIRPFNWGSEEGQPADIDWFIFHSAAVLVLPQLDLGGYFRETISEIDPLSAFAEDVQLLRSGAWLSPSGERFARLTDEGIELGSVFLPDEVERTVPLPEPVYATDSRPDAPYRVRFRGWSDETTVLFERGTRRHSGSYRLLEIWAIDVTGNRDPVLLYVQNRYPDRTAQFFESPGILTMTVNRGGSTTDILEVWSVDGDQAEFLSSGATPKNHLSDVYVPEDRPDRVLFQFDGVVQVYDTDNFRLLTEIRGSVPASANAANARVQRMATDADGRTLVLAWDNGTIDVWDLENQQPIGTWDLMPEDTRQLRYSRVWTQH